MKKWISDHIVVSFIILSTLFAVAVHIAFSIIAPCEWISAKWGAGEILTYVSTVSLGLLAVWQNQRFKDENDKAQKRLEKLTQQANELAVISKIIEAESSRIEQTSMALDKFYSYCDCQKITSVYLDNRFNPVQRSATLVDWRSDSLNAFNDVLYQIGRDTCVDIGDILCEILRLSDGTYKFIDVLLSDETEDYSSEIKKLSQMQLDYLSARGTYFVETDAQYRRLVYGNITLADIQSTYCKIDQRRVMEEVMEKWKK